MKKIYRGSHNLVATCAVEVTGTLYPWHSGAHPSLFATFFFPDLKQEPINSFPVVGWQRPGSMSQTSGTFLHQNRVVLTS